MMLHDCQNRCDEKFVLVQYYNYVCSCFCYFLYVC